MKLEGKRTSSRSSIHRLLIVALLALTGALTALAPAHAGGREAITLWWVIFNNPEACTDGCGEDDLLDPEVAASVVYASGQLAKAKGKVQLVASLNEQSRRFADELLGGPGLIDAEKAEIHIVVRSHGRRISGKELEQITRFLDPGCQDLGGPNVCEDIQFAVHLPGPAKSESPVFWFPNLHGGEQIIGAASTLFRDQQGVRVVVETKTK